MTVYSTPLSAAIIWWITSIVITSSHISFVPTSAPLPALQTRSLYTSDWFANHMFWVTYTQTMQSWQISPWHLTSRGMWKLGSKNQHTFEQEIHNTSSKNENPSHEEYEKKTINVNEINKKKKKRCSRQKRKSPELRQHWNQGGPVCTRSHVHLSPRLSLSFFFCPLDQHLSS